MTEEKIDLHWGKFMGQLGLGLFALACAAYADQQIFAPDQEHHHLINSGIDAFIGAILIMGTFAFALWMFRVPYRNDMFERRLRNWSMTASTMILFVFSVSINMAYQGQIGEFLITPYTMPALWLICYLIYSQYTRYCIAHGKHNSFLDGNGC